MEEENTHFSIKDWSLSDRPREKLLHKGSSSLSEAELIAILIGSGTRKMSAVELSRIIIKDAQNSLVVLGKKKKCPKRTVFKSRPVCFNNKIQQQIKTNDPNKVNLKTDVYCQ